MAVLLSMDIKGLVKPKDEERGMNADAAVNPGVQPVTLQAISAEARKTLSANLSQQITELEDRLKTASGAEQTTLQKELAKKWDDVNKPGPSAFYYEQVALKDNTYQNWMITGDRFTDAYQNTQDSLMQPALVQKAINAYQKAIKINPDGLDAKTGLGVAYVSGTPNPMQGIQLLLEVVKTEPENIKANMSLGLFSMKSGQYDKAIGRFKTVTSQKAADPEAWFYLASSYENLGQKADAIAAYNKSKELAADAGLTQFIEGKIEELKK